MKLSILTILGLVAVASSAHALTIVKPVEGETYTVGQKLIIEVQVLPEDQVEHIVIQTRNFEGTILDAPPYIYEVTISKPINGKEPIAIMAHRKNLKPTTLSTYIYAKLPSDLEVKDIVLEESLALVIMRPSGIGRDAIKADGIFSDGSRYPINRYSNAKYNIADDTIAKVDSAGEITGVSPGSTTVTLTAGGISKEINVKVIYKIEPVKGIKVVAAEKSNEIKWEKSPYEGEIVSGYKIYRTMGEFGKYGGEKVQIGNVPTGVSSFVDTQIKAGIKYYYSVEAFSQKYNSGSSMKGLWTLPSAAPQPANQ